MKRLIKAESMNDVKVNELKQSVIQIINNSTFDDLQELANTLHEIYHEFLVDNMDDMIEEEKQELNKWMIKKLNESAKKLVSAAEKLRDSANSLVDVELKKSY